MRRGETMTIRQALEHLELLKVEELTKDLVMKHFRRLSLKHHPDKGGSAQQFALIVRAKKVVLGAIPTAKKIAEKSKTTTVYMNWAEIFSGEAGNVYEKYVKTYRRAKK